MSSNFHDLRILWTDIRDLEAIADSDVFKTLPRHQQWVVSKIIGDWHEKEAQLDRRLEMEADAADARHEECERQREEREYREARGG